jgi:hypothetical protein
VFSCKAIVSNSCRPLSRSAVGVAKATGVCFSKRRACSRVITGLFHLLGTEFEARFSVTTKPGLGLKRMPDC